jgi:hypothetical protein
MDNGGLEYPVASARCAGLAIMDNGQAVIRLSTCAFAFACQMSVTRQADSRGRGEEWGGHRAMQPTGEMPCP